MAQRWLYFTIFLEVYIITYIHNIENTDTHVYTTVHVYIEYKFVDTITVLQNYIITYDKICNLVKGLFYVHNIYTSIS